jgi:hypothetical protein
MSKDDDTAATGSNRDTHYAKLRRSHRDAKREREGLPPVQPRGKRDLPARKGALYADAGRQTASISMGCTRFALHWTIPPGKSSRSKPRATR